MRNPRANPLLGTAALILLSASGGFAAADGDPALGALAIQHYGCGVCHAIPGIPGARGIVGPPLGAMAERGYLGGVLANTRENLIRWLLDPPAADPSTAMPNMGLTEAEARNIAAYLYTLE